MHHIFDIIYLIGHQGSGEGAPSTTPCLCDLRPQRDAPACRCGRHAVSLATSGVHRAGSGARTGSGSRVDAAAHRPEPGDLSLFLVLPAPGRHGAQRHIPPVPLQRRRTSQRGSSLPGDPAYRGSRSGREDHFLRDSQQEPVPRSRPTLAHAGSAPPRRGHVPLGRPGRRQPDHHARSRSRPGAQPSVPGRRAPRRRHRSRDRRRGLEQPPPVRGLRSRRRGPHHRDGAVPDSRRVDSPRPAELPAHRAAEPLLCLGPPRPGGRERREGDRSRAAGRLRWRRAALVHELPVRLRRGAVQLLREPWRRRQRLPLHGPRWRDSAQRPDHALLRVFRGAPGAALVPRADPPLRDPRPPPEPRTGRDSRDR